MLENFVKLADATDEEIRQYACKYGVLHLCKEHFTPVGHYYNCPSIMRWQKGGDSGVLEVTFMEGEPLRKWREYANEAQGLLNISANLHEGKLGRKEDCLKVKNRNYFNVPNYVESYLKSNEREKAIVQQRRYVDYAVNSWLEEGAVTPV